MPPPSGRGSRFSGSCSYQNGKAVSDLAADLGEHVAHHCLPADHGRLDPFAKLSRSWRRGRKAIPLSPAAQPDAASVATPARTCAEAAVRATALMAFGPDRGGEMARRHGLDALILLRDDVGGVRTATVGRLFSGTPAAPAPAEWS